MELFDEGPKIIFWQGPRIGICGEPIDTLRVAFGRVRAIPDIIIGFDGERDGWIVYGSFRTKDGKDFELREVMFYQRKIWMKIVSHQQMEKINE